VKTRFIVAALSVALAVNAWSADSDVQRTTQWTNGVEATSDAYVASILVYHRFGPVASDAMTVRTQTFRGQLAWLRDHGRPIVPLRQVVDSVRGIGTAPPPRAVVLTVDDGHRTVFTEMWPVVRDYGVPVTLFIYPSAISNASYAMTWEELATLQQTGLFDVQSHTYWHPNFKTERRTLLPSAYDALVSTQLARSRAVLASKVGGGVDLVAWPFGIYDDDLLGRAAACGYVAGLTLDRRPVTTSERVMALPRYLITDSVGAALAQIVGR
jgi:peptidoglycan/xylan/chitin deacetylase (PgdA/CDA1 family)